MNGVGRFQAWPRIGFGWYLKERLHVNKTVCKGSPEDLRLLQVLGFLVRELAIHNALVDTLERVEADDRTGDIARNPSERDLSMQAVRD